LTQPPARRILLRLLAWLPAILWAALISYASTDTFSEAHTSLIILPILRWLMPHASAATLEYAHTFIRKGAHFTEYFIFSVLLMRAVRGDRRGWQLRWALAALALAAGYSALDEFHQSFVPSRSASPWDSLLDTAGAAAAQAAVWFRARVQAARAESADKCFAPATARHNHNQSDFRG
jgi:VanZ family protein